MIEQNERSERLSEGLLCYLHLWAALHKHVQLPHDEIGADINLWADDDGGYFAAFTQDSPKKLSRVSSYVCALGEDGPVVGQLDQLPPAKPVKIKDDARNLLNALATGGPRPGEQAWKQVQMVASLIAKQMAH